MKPELRLLSPEYPLYASDGTPLGFRSRAAVERLLAMRVVRPVYGRKGHLKAIFLPAGDGAHPIRRPTPGTQYSYQQHFNSGTSAWTLKRLGKKDELRSLFLQVVADCLRPESTPGISNGSIWPS